MVYYMGEVKKEAVDFISNCFDDVLSALESDEEYLFDESGVDDAFWESVIDRSYSLTDAAFVIENSNNVESDSGLWDGKDPAEALETQAAFTYGNDVRSEVEDIYEDLKLEFDDKKTEVYNELEAKNIEDVASDKGDEDYDPDEDALESAKIYIKEYFDEKYEERDVPQVTLIGDKIRMIEKYLSLGDNADLWEGYPCGSSYIDSRCGVGFGMPNIHDYVTYDHMISKAIPEIYGKNKSEIKAYLEELKQSNH